MTQYFFDDESQGKHSVQAFSNHYNLGKELRRDIYLNGVFNPDITECTDTYYEIQ